MIRPVHHRGALSGARDRVFGWLGTLLLLAILPIKLMRFMHHGIGTMAIGVAPSILGSAGLMFLVLSSSGRISRLSLAQVALMVAALSATVELAQLLPRPGFLARAHYTFDYNDLLASVAGVVFAYVIAGVILRKLQATYARD